MANTIKPKRSSTASKVPTTTDLASGEIGVNMADQKVYINNGTSVVQVGAGKLSALGETSISSPASAQYFRYNGTNWVNSAIQAADVPTLNQNTTGSAAKWTTARTLSHSGDMTGSASVDGSANVAIAMTLATVNSNVGSFGSGTSIPVVTVNAKGLVTAVSTAAVQGGQYFGTAATKAIAYNSNTISENVTVTTGNNGLSAGPITVTSGYTVTVQSGAVWTIVN